MGCLEKYTFILVKSLPSIATLCVIVHTGVPVLLNDGMPHDFRNASTAFLLQLNGVLVYTADTVLLIAGVPHSFGTPGPHSVWVVPCVCLSLIPL